MLVRIANQIHTFANYYFSNYNYTKALANHWVFTCTQLKTSLAIFIFCLGPVNIGYMEHARYLSWVGVSSNGHRSKLVLVAGEVHIGIATLHCYSCPVQLERMKYQPSNIWEQDQYVDTDYY